MDEFNKNKFKVLIALSSIIGTTGFFLIFVVFVTVFFISGLFEPKPSSNNGIGFSSSSECGFTISDTSLSKSEFKKQIQEYANTHRQWQVFADNANDYYDYAKAKGVNPELVVLIASKEGDGYTTSGSNNYWGLACPNGASKCGSYSSFMQGAKMVIDMAAQYNTLMDLFVVGHYSYIGEYWYNPGSWSLGGCAYAEYIYANNMPDRVKKACAKGNTCSGSSCVKTTDEDQEAYATWLINEKMAKPRITIFGLEPNEGVSCSSPSSNNVVESYVQWMINFAADDTHGYSQDTRYLNPNVDCSSFVYYGLVNGAGFSEDKFGSTRPFTTKSMPTDLTNLGFKAHVYTSESELQRGDILWSIEHTEVYIGNGQNVGAHSNYDGKNGDSSGKEVSVSKNWRSWTSYYRYEGE